MSKLIAVLLGLIASLAAALGYEKTKNANKDAKQAVADKKVQVDGEKKINEEIDRIKNTRSKRGSFTNDRM